MDVLTDPRVALDLDAAEALDLGDLGVEHLFWQMPVGDPPSHHPSGLGKSLEDLDAITQPPQMVGARKSPWARADDRDVLAVQLRERLFDRILYQREAEVSEETLDVANADGFVMILAVTRRLAGVIADPPRNRRHWIVLHDGEIAVEKAIMLDEVEVFLDLLACGTSVITRGRLVSVNGTVEAKVSCGKELLAGLFGGSGSHPSQRKAQVLRDPRALYRHSHTSRLGAESAIWRLPVLVCPRTRGRGAALLP
jgi:hypothetical protein